MQLVTTAKSSYESQLVLDCANGVGALPMGPIADKLRNYIDI